MATNDDFDYSENSLGDDYSRVPTYKELFEEMRLGEEMGLPDATYVTCSRISNRDLLTIRAMDLSIEIMWRARGMNPVVQMRN